MTLRFDDPTHLSEYGFAGFFTVQELQETRCRSVPSEPGVYLVVRPGTTLPIFLRESIGGHFKDRNPTVTTEKLVDKWLKSVSVLYIGKAGSLRNRLKQYMDFGLGKPVGHHGGRYIWQLEHSTLLQLCWKATPDQDPAFVESHLIQTFNQQHGRLPFANLRF